MEKKSQGLDSCTKVHICMWLIRLRVYRGFVQQKFEALLKSRIPNRNKIVFLSRADEIDGMLQQGISMRQLYFHFIDEGIFSLTYSAFTKLCNRLLPIYRKSVGKNDGSEGGATVRSIAPTKHEFVYDPFNREGDD